MSASEFEGSSLVSHQSSVITHLTHHYPPFIFTPTPLRSLSVFGDVFSAIVTEKNYIPYRNAKLTLLLQEVLRVDSKLLLIANVTADDDGSKDEAATLTFAARCRGDLSLGHAELSSSLTNPF
jgi:hypothetical protein